MKKLCIKFLYFSLLTFLLSCSGNKEKIYKADLEMFKDYLDYIKFTKEGRKSIAANFGNNANITFFFKEFPFLQTNVLVMMNAVTKQQYFIFSSNFSLPRKEIIPKAVSTPGLGSKKATFNKEFLELYLKVEEFIEPKVRKNMNKVLIGFDGGAVVATMFAYNMVYNLGIEENEIEVVTFGMPRFANNFIPTFSLKEIILERDDIAFTKSACCNFPHHTNMKIIGKGIKVNENTRLESYIQVMKDEILD